MVDLEKAKLDPTSVFKRPNEILSCESLSKENKIELLQRWAYDEQELLVAEEENMPSTHSTDILEEVLAALTQLGASLKQS